MSHQKPHGEGDDKVSGIEAQFSLVFLFTGAALTDGMLLELSRRMTNPGQLRRLVTMGLGLKQHALDSNLENTRDISEAALSILKEWNLSQENPTVAHNRLCEALNKVDMCFLIQDILTDPG